MGSSSNAAGWQSLHLPSDAQQEEFAAAESLLQHSRSARSNDSSQAMNAFAPMPADASNYMLEANETSRVPMNPMNTVQFPHFGHAFQPPSAPEHVPPALNASLGGPSPPTQGLQGSYDQPIQTTQQSQVPNSSAQDHRGSHSSGHARSNAQSADGSEPPSPANMRGAQRADGAKSWTPRSNTDGAGARPSSIKEDAEEKPAWTELKTKAGKERKRLPLACIACRRKKIRCSGEKPACKHCQRSRVPCVYKVTTRKAAPRTDYMAMLDRRLKRMEDRVIKIIPKDETMDAPPIPRAVLKPRAPGQANTGKKRAAEEAFGPQLDEWANAKSTAPPQKGKKTDESKINTEGAEHLPSAEIQEHLSEVFFDCLYGQSYHLMHKPSYMRRLR